MGIRAWPSDPQGQPEQGRVGDRVQLTCESDAGEPPPASHSLHFTGHCRQYYRILPPTTAINLAEYCRRILPPGSPNTAAILTEYHR